MRQAALVMLAGAFAGAGCGGGNDSGELHALRADPLGRYVPAGATLVHEEGESGGKDALGKVRGASLSRDFNLRTREAPALTISRAVKVATDAGWTLDRSSLRTEGYARLTRQAGSGVREATISLPRADDYLPGPMRWPAMVITLRGV